MDREEKEALNKLLKKIPEDDLAKAVGGLTKRQRKTLIIVGGFLAAVISAVGVHQIIKYRRKKAQSKEQAAGLIGGADTPGWTVAGDEGADVELETRTEKACLDWMKEHKLSSDSRKGWTNDTIKEYHDWGGKWELMPGLVKYYWPKCIWK